MAWAAMRKMLAMRLLTLRVPAFEDAASADPLVRAQSQPGCEGFGAAELFADRAGAAQFAHQGAEHAAAHAGDAAQVHAEQPVRFLIDGHRMVMRSRGSSHINK